MLPHWLIKLGFHLLYNQLAWTYDLVAWLVSFGQWAAWRRLSLRHMRPGPTLELAFGTGGFFVDMARAGYRPAGIDQSPFMARLARRRLHRHNLPAPLSRAQAQHLPFPAGLFVNVVATFPTNYIFMDETLAEIRRVLAADGQLIVVFEGQLRGPWPLRPFIDWLYAITNQRGFHTLRPLSAFEAQGLAARWEMVDHNGARARVLLARRQ